MGPDNPAGLNVVPLTPAPLQVPPEVPVRKAFKLTAPPASQSVVVFQEALVPVPTMI